jgi:pyruvate dehydrogenase E1 component
MSSGCWALPRALQLVTVIDGHPATLAWLGRGRRAPDDLAHGVEHFGQTGTIGDLYRHFRIDVPARAKLS